MRMAKPAKRLSSFDLTPGQVLGNKYIVEDFLGGGLQGEVYKVVERRTKIPRAAKLFYPRHNQRDRAARSYARKLNHLRHCPLIIQYHHVETLEIEGVEVTCLFSDLVDGVLLSDYVGSRPGKRLNPFEAMHIAYQIVCGLEQIHAEKEYHGDLHEQNILIRPSGIFFDIKIIDFFDLGRSSKAHHHSDIVDITHILYWMVGGKKFYPRQSALVKSICLGRRRDRIVKHFPTARHLRLHFERYDAGEFA